MMLTYKVNGRTRYFNRLTSIAKVGPGRWDAVRNGTTYRIEGGKGCGGSRRDWFVDCHGQWPKCIVCTSLMDALNLLENM